MPISRTDSFVTMITAIRFIIYIPLHHLLILSCFLLFFLCSLCALFANGSQQTFSFISSSYSSDFHSITFSHSRCFVLSAGCSLLRLLTVFLSLDSYRARTHILISSNCERKKGKEKKTELSVFLDCFAAMQHNFIYLFGYLKLQFKTFNAKSTHDDDDDDASERKFYLSISKVCVASSQLCVAHSYIVL